MLSTIWNRKLEARRNSHPFLSNIDFSSTSTVDLSHANKLTGPLAMVLFLCVILELNTKHWITTRVFAQRIPYHEARKVCKVYNNEVSFELNLKILSTGAIPSSCFWETSGPVSRINVIPTYTMPTLLWNDTLNAVPASFLLW